MTALIVDLVAGAAVGLALGALGAGGSILAVPALIYLLGFGPVEATTAGLVVVLATSLSALPAHARAGEVRWRVGLIFAAAGLVPAALAGSVSAHVPAAVLTLGFAALAVLAAVRMLRCGPPPAAPPQVSAGRAAFAGAGLGGVTGLFGVGGGFLAVPALVATAALPMGAAVGTGLVIISANALVALLARLGTAAAVDWAVMWPFLIAAVIGAWFGGPLTARLPHMALQRVFGAVLLAVSASMCIGALL